jgi:hypothetical protein
MVTQSPKTLVPKLKMNPSEVNDMLNLAWYLQNPQYDTFFEVLSDDEVVGNNTKIHSEDSSSGLDE